VFLEDGHGFWEMFFDDPFDEIFVAAATFAIMSDGVLHTLTLRCFGGVRHVEVFVVGL
jgi:hypothetical protein